MSFNKFSGLYGLLVSVKANMTKNFYHEEKSCM